ncbi:unnamed protein product [Camellia sinensis]
MDDLAIATQMSVHGKDDVQSKRTICLEFDSEQAAYDFYASYGRRVGFSIRRGYAAKSKSGEITSRTFVCSKEGYKKPDKRDCRVKNAGLDTRTDCRASMSIKLNRQTGKYWVINLVETHNHPLVVGVSADQKNYLRTKRQRMMAFGEAGIILKYFQNQRLQDPTFFYAVQLDSEEKITNVLWADTRMIMDYGKFGDVVAFNTTYKLDRENRPFVLFIGFNNHQETIVFGAALMYDDTVDSYVWLFQTFLEAMSNKHPYTIFTDQDATMARAISFVMPNTYHRLCTWHIKQNALKHVNSIFKGPGGVSGVLEKFMNDYEGVEEFLTAWKAMLDEYGVYNNTWLRSIFELKEKWVRAYVKWGWSAGMKSTQLSESLNADLKDCLRSDHNLVQFFTHFERMLNENRYKECESEYALSYKLSDIIKVPVQMLIQAGTIYTRAIFEEFQDQYVGALELCITNRAQGVNCLFYTVTAYKHVRIHQVWMDRNGYVTCCCRLFEMKGILCSHVIKVLKDEMNIMEIPSHYILKRWTRKARAEMIQDFLGCNSEVDPKLEQSSRYRSLCSLFIKILSRASELEETYKMSVEHGKNLLKLVEDMLESYVNDQTLDTSRSSSSFVSEDNDKGGCMENKNATQAKGLKKKIVSHYGKRRRYKRILEKALVLARKRKNFRQAVQIPPNVLPYLMSQCGNVPNSMPWIWNGMPQYTNFQALCQGPFVNYVIQPSQRSVSTHCSQVVNLNIGDNRHTPANSEHPGDKPTT